MSKVRKPIFKEETEHKVKNSSYEKYTTSDGFYLGSKSLIKNIMREKQSKETVAASESSVQQIATSIKGTESSSAKIQKDGQKTELKKEDLNPGRDGKYSRRLLVNSTNREQTIMENFAKTTPALAASGNSVKKISDFSIFSNPESFASTIDLKDASVIECVEYYMKYKMSESSDKRLYQRIIKIVKEIEDEYSFKLMPIVVGDTFWLHWQEYLLHTKNLSGSTVLSMTTGLSTTLTWAARYGSKISITLDNHDIVPFSRKPRISLNSDEVSRITYFDIDAAAQKFELRPQLVKTLKKVRDNFVISCGLGQRYSDIKRMDKSCFNFSGSLRYQIVQQKTGNKAIVDINKMCPYPNVVSRLLEQYDYCAPFSKAIEDYNRYLHFLFKIAGFDDKIIHEYKDAGKIIRLEYEKWELVTSHTARRTFITNAIKNGINAEYVRRASGHASEKSFSRYILFGDDE